MTLDPFTKINIPESFRKSAPFQTFPSSAASNLPLPPWTIPRKQCSPSTPDFQLLLTSNITVPAQGTTSVSQSLDTHLENSVCITVTWHLSREQHLYHSHLPQPQGTVSFFSVTCHWPREWHLCRVSWEHKCPSSVELGSLKKRGMREKGPNFPPPKIAYAICHLSKTIE